MTRVGIANSCNGWSMPRRRKPVTDGTADNSAQRQINPAAARTRCPSGNQQNHPHTVTDGLVQSPVKPVMRRGKVVAMQVNRAVGRDLTSPDLLVPCAVERVRGWLRFHPAVLSLSKYGSRG